MRVQEGYTCDCFEGFQLDMAQMACVGKFSLRVAMPGKQTGLDDSLWRSDWPAAHVRNACLNLG